jgi:hypothetical protein
VPSKVLYFNKCQTLIKYSVCSSGSLSELDKITTGRFLCRQNCNRKVWHVKICFWRVNNKNTVTFKCFSRFKSAMTCWNLLTVLFDTNGTVHQQLMMHNNAPVHSTLCKFLARNYCLPPSVVYTASDFYVSRTQASTHRKEIWLHHHSQREIKDYTCRVKKAQNSHKCLHQC